MNTAERRGEILKILHNADAPVAAREQADLGSAVRSLYRIWQ